MWYANVVTLQRGLHNVECQRHDVIEAWFFGFVQRRDITERVKFKKKLQNFLSLRKLLE